MYVFKQMWGSARRDFSHVPYIKKTAGVYGS